MRAKEDLARLYKSVAIVYYNNNQGNKAFDYLSLSNVYHDSVYDDKKQIQLLKLEKQYETQKIQDSLRLSEQKVATSHSSELAAKEQAAKTIWQLTGAIGLTLFTLILLLFVYRNAKNQRKLNLALSEKNDEINKQKLIIEEKNTELTDSITYAKRIQSAILPSRSEINHLFSQNFVLYLPKDIVAGDFYWMEKLNDRVLIAVADCTGHGVPGAMVSVVCNNALNRAVRELRLSKPSDILDKTRDMIVAEFQKSGKDVKDGMDISLLSVRLQPINGQRIAEYAGANNPLYIARQGEPELLEIKADKQPVGLFDHPLPFTNTELKLQEGDTLYLASDGFADQFGGEKKKKYKTSTFRLFLRGLSEKDMHFQLDELHKELITWRGSLEQLDDICIVGLRV